MNRDQENPQALEALARQAEGRFSGMMRPRKPCPEDRAKAAALLKALGLDIVNRGFDPTLN